MDWLTLAEHIRERFSLGLSCGLVSDFDEHSETQKESLFRQPLQCLTVFRRGIRYLDRDSGFLDQPFW